jgi:hypothetical protein
MWCLLGLLNSLVANYLVRLQVTTHVTTSLMSRLPVPRPPSSSMTFKAVASHARHLASAGCDGAPGAYAQLNAFAATAYGISVEQYRHIVDTFPLLDADLRSQCVAAFARKHGNTETRKP